MVCFELSFCPLCFWLQLQRSNLLVACANLFLRISQRLEQLIVLIAELNLRLFEFEQFVFRDIDAVISLLLHIWALELVNLSTQPRVRAQD